MVASPNQPNQGQPTSTRPSGRRAGRWRWALPIALIVIGAGLLLYPFIPALKYALVKPDPVIPYQTRLASGDDVQDVLKALPSLPEIGNRPVPKDNRMVIPSINIDMSINEGATEKTLDLGGIWHIPKTSNPEAGGNFVLSGHRWQYLPPSNSTLYLLDKVKDGEPVIVYWKGVEYDYKIVGREIVDPTRVDILDNTDEPRLTIFTCTPLFSTKQRLVLYGELIPA